MKVIITAQDIQDLQVEQLKMEIEQLELKIKVEKLKMELAAREFMNKQQIKNEGDGL